MECWLVNEVVAVHESDTQCRRSGSVDREEARECVFGLGAAQLAAIRPCVVARCYVADDAPARAEVTYRAKITASGASISGKVAR